jgi:hypothetical protein
MSRSTYLVGGPAVRPLIKLPIHVPLLHLRVVITQARDHESINGGGVLFLIGFHVFIIHSPIMLTH